MKDYKQVAADTAINEAAKHLAEHNFETFVVGTKEEAKAKVLELIPKGAEVMTMTSVTLEETGLAQAINESGEYEAVKPKLAAMDRATQGREMQKLGAAAQVSVGSVHAVTEDGKVLIASNSGSQLPGYAYGSDLVIWVVGAQKIVENTDAGIRRIYDYVLPLESERAHKAYGVPGSFVSKLLIYNKEPNPKRIKIVMVKEALGY